MGGEGPNETPRPRPRESGRPSEHLREQVNVTTHEQAERRIRDLVAQRQREISNGYMTSARLRENYKYMHFLEKLQWYLNPSNYKVPDYNWNIERRRAFYQNMVTVLTQRLRNRYFGELPSQGELPGIQPFSENFLAEINAIFFEEFGNRNHNGPNDFYSWGRRYDQEQVLQETGHTLSQQEQAWLRANPNAPPEENPYEMERRAARYAGIPPPQAPPEPERRARTGGSTNARPSESHEALLPNDPIDPRKKAEIVEKFGQIVQREWRVSGNWDPSVRMQTQWFVDLLPTAGYYQGLANNLTEREAGQYVSVIIRKLQDEATTESFLSEIGRMWENIRRDLPNPHPERNNPNLQNGINLLQADNLRHVLGTLREEFIDNVVDDENDANEHFDALVLPEYERMLANMVASSTAEQGLRVGHDRVITNYHLNQAGQNRTFNTGITNSAQRRIREMKARVRREGRRNHTDQDDIDERIQERTTEIQAETRGMLEVASSPRGRLALYYYNYLVNLYGPTVGGGEEGNAFRQRAANFRLTAIRDWSQRLAQIRFNRDGWVQGWNR